MPGDVQHIVGVTVDGVNEVAAQADLCRPIITAPSLADQDQTRESLFDGNHNAFIDTIGT